ncbi:MAG: hypothetical protein AB7S75_19585 [Desulfococcaceae bacterium]
MKYTCTQYREEMLLLALRTQLAQKNLTGEQKKEIQEKIKKLEKEMDME